MKTLSILLLVAGLLFGQLPAIAQSSTRDSLGADASSFDVAELALAKARSQGMAVNLDAAELAALIDDFESSRFVMGPSSKSASAKNSSWSTRGSTRRYTCPPFRSHGWWGTREVNIWATAKVSNGRITEVTDHDFSYGLYGHVIPSLDWVVTGSTYAYDQSGGRRIRLGFSGQGKLYFAGVAVSTRPIDIGCSDDA